MRRAPSIPHASRERAGARRLLAIRRLAIGLWSEFDGARWAVLILFMTRTLGLGPTIIGVALAVPSEVLTALASGPPLQAAVMAVAGFFLAGVVIPVYDINQFSVRQAVIPLPMQGRANATMRTIIRGAVPLGAMIGGPLAERIGLRGVMVFAALGGVAAFLAIWFSPVCTMQTLPTRAPATAA